jgi:LPS export ABC transporter permease LptG
MTILPRRAAGRRLSRLGRFRLKTVDIYVARQFLGAYVICAISFIGLFVLIEAFAKLDRFLSQDAPLIASILSYHVAMIPTLYASFLGPVLTLAAGMFTVASLNRHNELVPLKAAGVSVYRILMPVFVLAALLMAGTFYLKDQVIPRFKDPIRAALSLSRARPLNPPPYFDRDNGFLIRVREYAPTRKIAQGIEISELHPNGKVKMEIDAHQMDWAPLEGTDTEEGHWTLHEGSIQRWDEEGNLIVNASASRFERLKAPFKRRELHTSLRPIDLETSDVEISYLSWQDLKKQYQRQPYHRHLAVKLHHHFAFPLSHVVLLFLGLPFVLQPRLRSGFLSIALSLAICGLFYLVSSICMSMASHESEVLSPILAAWLPIMVFGSLGITLFDRLPS